MYKVFVNGHLLFITAEPQKNAKGGKKMVNIEYSGEDTFPPLIDKLESENDPLTQYCVYGPDIVVMWRQFRSNYKLVVAAGGLVRNPKNKILFIFRNKKWDLPKGKAEPGELIEETALREVKEECGIHHLILISPLAETYHTYGPKGSRRLKKTWWYKMYSDEMDLIPQKEEGITKIKWVKEEKLEKIFMNTFPSIIDVVEADLQREFTPIPLKWHNNINFE